MKYFLQIVLIALLPMSAHARETKLELPPMIAPEIRHGQLPNGLRYFIKENANPAGKVEMRLLVNVGSMHEAEDERGLAHLLEHMALRRTQHFGQGKVKAFIESEGMRLGHDTNAFTSHETTIYKLVVGNQQADQALQLLADWASGGIVLDAAELATEKNVVLDEGRQRAEGSVFYQQLMQTLFPNSKYPERLAIGSADVVKNVSLEKLQAFYQREYQAQRMTLMIAGDVNPAELEKNILAQFAAVQKDSSAVNLPPPAAVKNLRLFSHRDMPGLAQPVVRWTWVLPVESMADSDAALRDFRYEMLSILIQQRLASQSRQANSALLETFGLYTHGGWALPTQQTELSFEAVVKDNKLKDALREIYRELERAKRFGFTDAEIKTAFAIRQKQSSEVLTNPQWADQMLNHVRFGESLRQPATLATLRDQFALQTSAADLQRQLQQLLQQENQVAYILQPKILTSLTLFSESSLRSMVEEVQRETMTEQAKTATKPLIAQPPIAGEMLAQTMDEASGGQLLKLSNGIEVLVIPPTFPNEDVGFAAVSHGGLLGLDKKLWPAGRVMNQYFVRVGLGDLSFSEVNQHLSLHPVTYQAVLGVDQFALLATAKQTELEALLQLQYLAFTSRRDDEAVRKASVDAAYQQSMGNYNTLISTLNTRRYGEHWPIPEYWIKDHFDTDSAQLAAVRQQLLANPAEFRFVITGVTMTAQVRQWIELYLGSLPTQPISAVTLPALSHGTPANLQQNAANLKDALRVLQVGLKVEPSIDSLVMSEALAELVRMRLFQALREVSGDTYGVQVGTEVNPSQGTLITVVFQNARAQCKSTASVVETELARLLASPPSEVEVQAVRDKINKTLVDLPRNPQMYANVMASQWLRNQGEALKKLPDLADYTPEMMHGFVKSWLSADRWTSGSFNCKNDIDFGKLRAATVIQ